MFPTRQLFRPRDRTPLPASFAMSTSTWAARSVVPIPSDKPVNVSYDSLYMSAIRNCDEEEEDGTHRNTPSRPL
jgi:hypothetical protein